MKGTGRQFAWIIEINRVVYSVHLNRTEAKEKLEEILSIARLFGIYFDGDTINATSTYVAANEGEKTQVIEVYRKEIT